VVYRLGRNRLIRDGRCDGAGCHENGQVRPASTDDRPGGRRAFGVTGEITAVGVIYAVACVLGIIIIVVEARILREQRRRRPRAGEAPRGADPDDTGEVPVLTGSPDASGLRAGLGPVRPPSGDSPPVATAAVAAPAVRVPDAPDPGGSPALTARPPVGRGATRIPLREAARTTPAAGANDQAAAAGPARARWSGIGGWPDETLFVGRQAELRRIDDLLQRRAPGGSGPEAPPIAVLSGPSGMGKSSLAAAYARLHGPSYPGGVVWLSASGGEGAGRPEESADGQLAALAVTLGLGVVAGGSDARRAAVRVALEDRGAPVLWVVDGVAGELAPWRSGATNVAELVTVRAAPGGWPEVVGVDVLAPDVALTLLARNRTLAAAEHKEAQQLAAELGHHPLACALVGRYIAASTTFGDYRRMLASQHASFDPLADELSDLLPLGHARQISAAIAMSLMTLGPLSWQLLRTTAQLAPTAVPRALLDSVDSRLHPRSVSDPLGAELEFNRAVADLHGDGLWQYDPDTATVSVHELIRLAAVVLDPEPDHRALTVTGLLDALSDTLEAGADDPDAHPGMALSVEHARYLASSGADVQRATRLSGLLGWYDLAAGRYRGARESLQRAYDTDVDLFGADHPDTLDAADKLAAALRALGDLRAARELNQRTYESRRAVLGADHPDTLDAANNLAATLWSLGD
jgi:hypothetical protein